MNVNNFNHSLLYNSSIIANFFKTFRLNPDDYQSDEDDQTVLERAVEYILTRYCDDIAMLCAEFKQPPFISNGEQYVVGELISVSYSPSSQRHIEYYDEQAFTGYIFFADTPNDTMFLFNRSADMILSHSLEREGCHYFGMCRSYTTHIHRIIPLARTPDENQMELAVI